MLHGTSIATVVTLHLLIAIGGFLHVEGKMGFGAGEQDWGYVTVRPQAHMFWWLHYTTSENVIDVHEKPLLIWLQGGPGFSSTGYGNFKEVGPLDLELNSRNFSLVKDYNVLFIDNPVGTGYSYVEDPSAYVTNNSQIALDLLECIKGFLTEFPKFTNVPTYIVGESYGGKMAVEFALLWDKAQKAGTIASNLRGVALGNSWISPIDSILSYAPFVFNTGFVDIPGFKTIDQAAKNIKLAVDNEEWVEAQRLFIDTVNVVSELTRNIHFYNVVHRVPFSWQETDKRNDILEQLMNSKVSPALGLNMTWKVHSQRVFDTLAEDFMKPVTDTVEMLLNETDIEVFVYSGQLDLIASTPGTLIWIDNLKWNNSNEWRNATRCPIIIDTVVEGYVKEYRNFKMYWMNRAGHMVVKDNPDATAVMLEHLTASETDEGGTRYCT